MPNLIVPNEALKDWLTAITDGDPTLTACRLRLIRDPVAIDRYTTLLELSIAECTFPGYTPQPLSEWSEPIIDDDDAMSEADPVTFTPTGPTTESVHGLFVTSVTGVRLFGAALLEAAVPLADGVDLQCVVTINLRSIFTA